MQKSYQVQIQRPSRITETCVVKEVSDPASVHLTLYAWNGTNHRFKGSDVYGAFTAMRSFLELEDCKLLCAGARPNVRPSGMSRSMGGGRKAYILRKGTRTQPEIVDIFDYAPAHLVGSIKEQKEFFKEWLHSIGIRGELSPEENERLGELWDEGVASGPGDCLSMEELIAIARSSLPAN